ncbi:MAG: DEAD/DEAH box helicase [Akkermansiaceae bacterium]|nr:DEAD/DEAH box helicase [Akkermansiaceae bacterium]
MGYENGAPVRFDRLAAAGVADSLKIDSSETIRALAKLGHNLRNISTLPPAEIPKNVKAELRHYQEEGFRWLQFLADHGLNGILADDMGLGKTVQTLTHLAAEVAKNPGKPSLVIAPTSVVPNWAAEAEKFTPHLKVVLLQGKERAEDFKQISAADVVLTSYPLLTRDFETLSKQDWHLIALDEAQYIKNPKAQSAINACKLKSAHRICLSGTPMENHLGELWSLMRFLMPGFLADEKTFNTQLRRPIERDRSSDAQLALNRRVSSLILRRTKDQVATELPPKTEIIHGIDLNKKQTDLYESVRAAMDQRVRDAIAAKGLAKSHIIVLDALLKLRQICCHPQLLKTPSAQKITESAKLEYLTTELLPTLIEEGRRILLFSTFTSMLALIEQHLEKEKIPFLKLTGQTQDRATLTKKFQTGEIPIFLISLKAGGTGLNLTAADTVIHYDPWWNPAAENQATDRAHRIGQTKPVFVHKLICRGTIEDRILELQKHKADLVAALLSDETSKLKIDSETLSHLLAPLG